MFRGRHVYWRRSSSNSDGDFGSLLFGLRNKLETTTKNEALPCPGNMRS
ncbi:hypothetical protein HanPI659440_Chr03g0122491 [Helianthus annuus]|nr:hypothetical protein HanPI659440_Chr03g0122491 [Helianthus annuus]